MEIQRIDGIKYNLDALSEDELETIHGHLLNSHAQITTDIETIEAHLFARRHPELPLDDEEEYPVVGEMGAMAVQSELTWERYIEAIGRDL